MIVRIEKRYEFESTALPPERHYELCTYERRTSIGVLTGRKLLKRAKDKKAIDAYLRKTGIKVTEEE